jgi:hypothetical protein
MAKHSSHILDLAKRGARERLQELVDEIKLLTVTFPDLRDSFDPDELPTKFILKRGHDKVEGASSVRRTISAKGRKAISDAQKARWAKQKADGKK